MKRITVIGGGNLGHTILAHLTKRKFKLNLLTRNPEKWNHDYHILKKKNSVEKICLKGQTITDDYEKIIPQSDMVIITSPVSTYESLIKKVASFANKNTKVGCIYQMPEVNELTRQHMNLDNFFCFQYVPYQAKIVEYGQSSNIVGFKNEITVAGKKDTLDHLEKIFGIPTVPCDYLSFTLTSSNPILHIPRYMDTCEHCDEIPKGDYELVKFKGSLYKDMNLSSSVIINDLMLEVLKVKDEVVSKTGIPLDNVVHIMERVKTQYGDQVGDYRNLQSMFNTAEMYTESSLYLRKYKNDNVLYPDVSHRHFTDDVSYGLIPLKTLAVKYNVKTPVLDICLKWAKKMMINI
jgi:hypothetical protein